MSTNDRDYSEKRDFIRMRVETPAQLIHGERSLDVICVDLSSTGLQVETSAVLPVGAIVRVRIASEHSALSGLDAEAEIVRANDLDNGHFGYGLTILSMK